jgi:hypothetical protein
MNEEWIIPEFVRARYNSGPGEEEMLGDQKKVFGPSVILGRGYNNLCLGSPEQRERRKGKKNKKKYTKEEKVHTLFKGRELCNESLRTKTQDSTSWSRRLEVSYYVYRTIVSSMGLTVVRE